jgi:hypothetical protein
MKNKPRFNISFFEFSFLVEACIPPRPIARACFWGDVIDKYYYVLTPDERVELYDWISKNSLYERSLQDGNEDCEVFEARFNPNNQYRVKTFYNSEEKYFDCFLYKNQYYTERNRFIDDLYIVSIEKISPN